MQLLLPFIKPQEFIFGSYLHSYIKYFLQTKIVDKIMFQSSKL